MINYTQILTNFLRALYGFSDPDYQKRVWVNGIGPECCSFESDICDYFDYSETIIRDHQLFGISPIQIQSLKNFDVLLQEFCNTIPEIVDEKNDILPNPKWHEIQRSAKEVLKTFSYNKPINPAM